MFKRILFSVGTISVVVAAAFVGTQALLSDSVTLGVNTVSTGSVDLQIWDGAAYVDGPVAGFTETLLPGQTSDETVVWLNNASTVALSIMGTATGVTEEVGFDSDDVTVNVTPYDDLGVTPGTTVTGTLTAWELGLAILPDIPAGTDQRYHVTVSVDSGVELPETSVTFDFLFTGTQVL